MSERNISAKLPGSAALFTGLACAESAESFVEIARSSSLSMLCSQPCDLRGVVQQPEPCNFLWFHLAILVGIDEVVQNSAAVAAFGKIECSGSILLGYALTAA